MKCCFIKGFYRLFVLVKEDPTKGVYVDKLSRHIVTDIDEARTLYEKGIKNRLAYPDFRLVPI